MLDLHRARRFVSLRPPPGRVLLCAVRGAEKGEVSAELAGLTGLWERLEDELTAAREGSVLPEEPTAAGDLEAWLVELRVAAL